MDQWRELSLALTEPATSLARGAGIYAIDFRARHGSTYLAFDPCFTGALTNDWAGSWLCLLAVGDDQYHDQRSLSPTRPFWIDPAVGIQETEGYGLANGYVQFATTITFCWLVGTRSGGCGCWRSSW